MNIRRQPDGLYFGPRSRMSTRLKVANGLSLRKSIGRFRSKPMLKIDRECQKSQANMVYMKYYKINYNVNDQRVNVVSQRSQKNPPKGRNVGSSNDVAANNSKSNHSLASKHARQPPSSRLEKGSSPSSEEFKCSKPSIRNVLRSKKLEKRTRMKSKDDSNTTSGRSEQFYLWKMKDKSVLYIESSHPSHLKAMASSLHKANNVDTSNLNNVALGSRLKDRSNRDQGEDIIVRMDDARSLKPLKGKEVSKGSSILGVSEHLFPNKDDSNAEKGRQVEVMTNKGKEIKYHTSEVHAICHDHRKQKVTMKTNGAPKSISSLDVNQHVQSLRSNSSDNVHPLFGKNRSRHHRDKTSLMEDNNCATLSSKDVLQSEFTETSLKLHSRVRSRAARGDGKTNDGKSKRKEALLEEKCDIHKSKGVVQQLDLNSRPVMMRRYIEANGGDDVCDQDPMGVEHDRGVIQRENFTRMLMMRQRRCIETNEDEADDGDQNPLGDKNDSPSHSHLENLTSRPMKKRRIYIEMNEDEADRCEWNPVGVDGGTNELAPEVDSSKGCVEQQCYCCSKPIDEPIWSGIFKIDGKGYISLAAHLSTKSGEKVWGLSRSLPPVVQVTKESKFAAWPKIWKASKPTCDSIGLYFFPHTMRHDEELDQLVTEVMDNDLVLRAVTGEAEMLIFPSILLPERYQTFQKKHYLWGAFKQKEDKATLIAERLNGIGQCAQEEEKEHVSNQLDEVQSEADQEMILMESAVSVQEVEACCVQGPTKMGLELKAPEEGRPRDASHQAVRTTESAAVATTVPAEATAIANAATVPTEATSVATDAATLPACHGLIHSSVATPPGSSSVFGIVVR